MNFRALLHDGKLQQAAWFQRKTIYRPYLRSRARATQFPDGALESKAFFSRLQPYMRIFLVVGLVVLGAFCLHVLWTIVGDWTSTHSYLPARTYTNPQQWIHTSHQPSDPQVLQTR
jgi:hypothetical protein